MRRGTARESAISPHDDQAHRRGHCRCLDRTGPVQPPDPSVRGLRSLSRPPGSGVCGRRGPVFRPAGLWGGVHVSEHPQRAVHLPRVHPVQRCHAVQEHGGVPTWVGVLGVLLPRPEPRPEPLLLPPAVRDEEPGSVPRRCRWHGHLDGRGVRRHDTAVRTGASSEAPALLTTRIGSPTCARILLRCALVREKCWERPGVRIHGPILPSGGAMREHFARPLCDRQPDSVWR